MDRMSAQLPEERVETPGRETRLTTAAEAAWLAAGSCGQIPGLRMSRRISSCVIGTGPPPNAPRPGRRPTPGSVASPLLFMRGPDGSRPGPTPLSVSVENVASDAGGRDGSPTAGASLGDTPPTDLRPVPTLSSRWLLKRNSACLNADRLTRVTFGSLNRGTITANQGVPESPSLPIPASQKTVCVDRVLMMINPGNGLKPWNKRFLHCH